MTKENIFVTGGTGYVGRALIVQLQSRGHFVQALVRRGSEGKLPAGCDAVFGDALDACSYAASVRPDHTFVQLVGVAHPNPAKAEQFRTVDFVAGREAVMAAKKAGVRHFVYLSVAQPAPIMKAYVQVRAEVEELIRENGLNATVLRPWYVLGPGHWWPCLLAPLYWIFENQAATRDYARRLGLVTLPQMIGAMVEAIENPQPGVRVWDVPQIKSRS